MNADDQFNPQKININNSLQPYIKRLAHVGYIVKDLSEAISFWQNTYGVTVQDISILPPFDQVTDETLTIFAFININGTCFELIQPLAEPFLTLLNNAPSGGGGINHLAWYVNDIEAAVLALKDIGVLPGYVTPNGIVNFGNKKLVYLEPKNTQGHYIELIELINSNENN